MKALIDIIDTTNEPNIINEIMDAQKNTTKPLLVSFSGGRTSAFMARYLQLRWAGKRDLYYVFANTGKEREETLRFVNECDRAWNLGVVWIEAFVTHEAGIGNSFKIVDFNTASRNGEPFEEMIKKHGIPNRPFPHCTKELKTVPIHKYMKSLNIGKWETAIGIRYDEMHRINREKAKRDAYVYPLADESRMTSLDIRTFWDKQQFDLGLKDYEGNCDMCWKKSKRKLLTMITENPQMIEWWSDMEIKYGNGAHNFFVSNKSAKDLVKESERPFTKAIDGFALANMEPSLFENEMDIEFDCFCKST